MKRSVPRNLRIEMEKQFEQVDRLKNGTDRLLSPGREGEGGKGGVDKTPDGDE
jgi:hypothetical protein